MDRFARFRLFCGLFGARVAIGPHAFTRGAIAAGTLAVRAAPVAFYATTLYALTVARSQWFPAVHASVPAASYATYCAPTDAVLLGHDGHAAFASSAPMRTEPFDHEGRAALVGVARDGLRTSLSIATSYLLTVSVVRALELLRCERGLHFRRCAEWTSWLAATATLQVLLTTHDPALAVVLSAVVAYAVHAAPRDLLWHAPKLRRPAAALRRPANASGPDTKCEHVDEDGVRCPKLAQRRASDGRRYCARHANAVDGLPTRSSSTCPYETAPGVVCGAKADYRVAGVFYCQRHKADVQPGGRSRSPIASRCPYETSPGVVCGERANKRVDGVLYCARHEVDVRGRRRGARAQEDDLTAPARYRLWGKQRAPNSRRRRLCQVCQRLRGQKYVTGRCICRACSLRRRWDDPSRAAVVCLEDWRDDLVMPFDVGPMGGDPSRVCSHCGSRNFAGELIGTGRRAHFTICCHNGKASGLRHRPFPEAPEEFVELLTATTRAGRLCLLDVPTRPAWPRSTHFDRLWRFD